MKVLPGVGLLIGRVLLAWIFIASGLGKTLDFAGTLDYTAAKGLLLPETVLILTILIELGGGLMIAAGFQARWAALVILLFLIPMTVIFHAFWSVPEEHVRLQMIQFQKNLAIMGGMLYIACCGPGPYSLDREDRTA